MLASMMASALWADPAPPTCPSGAFRSSVNLSFCPELTRAAEATTMEACRELCCGNATCGVWEWCPDSTPGCAHWAGARCHIGPAPTGPCPWASHWVGETRADLPPPPPPPPGPGPHPPHGPPPAAPSGPPATRKQGFSGFLGPDFSCGDAAALGLSDSWCASPPAQHPPSQEACSREQVLHVDDERGAVQDLRRGPGRPSGGIRAHDQRRRAAEERRERAPCLLPPPLPLLLLLTWVPLPR